MKKILVEDFEKHGFKITRINDELVKLEKNYLLLYLIFDCDGDYIEMYKAPYIDRVIYADKVNNFNDIMKGLAERFEKLSFYYKSISSTHEATAREIRKEIEKCD